MRLHFPQSTEQKKSARQATQRPSLIATDGHQDIRSSPFDPQHASPVVKEALIDWIVATRIRIFEGSMKIELGADRVKYPHILNGLVYVARVVN